MSTVNSSGFKYRMELLGVQASSLLTAFDFTNNPSSNGGFVNPAYWATGSYSGKVNGSTSSFSQRAGSGYFLTSNSVDIMGSIPSDNFSFLFCYDRVSNGSQTILTSSTGSNFSSCSGLTLGINDSNSLYLEYWNPVDGIFSFTFPYDIASKNVVYLNKGFQNFNLGVFNPSLGNLNFYSFPIYNSSYAHCDKFRLGGAYSNFWSSGSGFNGYFDDFYCLNESFPLDYIPALCSGFYSCPVSGSLSGTIVSCENITTLSGSGINLGTGITGYITTVQNSTGYVPTGYYTSGYRYPVGTGITGYENKFIGNVQDACGFSSPLYVLNPLTGWIYASGTTGLYSGTATVITPTYITSGLTGYFTGSVFVAINTTQCTGKEIYYPSRIDIDTGFIYSLGFNSIYRLNNCLSPSTGEVYVYPNKQSKMDLNVIPSYDSSISEYILSNSYSGQNLNLIFRNGKLLLESGFSFYTDGYSQKYNLSGDYFISGQKNIMSNGLNKITDNMLHDYSTGLNRSARFVQSAVAPGSNLSSYFTAPFTDMSLFLNGRKLLSGVEYNLSTINIGIPASSVLIKISDSYASTYKINKTGLGNLFSGFENFLPGNSQVYSSGIRLMPGSEYIEISNYEMLSGCPVVSSNNLLYSSLNNQSFWF